MKKRFTVAVTVALLAAVTACGAGGQRPTDDDDHEAVIACYKADGSFAKFDDDCHDDGLFATPPKPKVTKTPLASKPSPIVRVTKRR